MGISLFMSIYLITSIKMYFHSLKNIYCIPITVLVARKIEMSKTDMVAA